MSVSSANLFAPLSQSQLWIRLKVNRQTSFGHVELNSICFITSLFAGNMYCFAAIIGLKKSTMPSNHPGQARVSKIDMHDWKYRTMLPLRLPILYQIRVNLSLFEVVYWTDSRLGIWRRANTAKAMASKKYGYTYLARKSKQTCRCRAVNRLSLARSGQQTVGRERSRRNTTRARLQMQRKMQRKLTYNMSDASLVQESQGSEIQNNTKVDHNELA